MNELSAQDRRLLTLLQEDCRLSNTDLATRAGLSTSACWRRLRALEEEGVIEKYVAVLNPAKLDLGFCAIVHVILHRHSHARADEFVSQVLNRDEVVECFATTGDADYHLRVVCASIEAYNEFLEGFLFRVEAVSNVRTNVVLKKIKIETKLPIGELYTR
jgi:Lrp/AsnC family transcriptional regulator, leucine-responsive regulatory protein